MSVGCRVRPDKHEILTFTDFSPDMQHLPCLTVQSPTGLLSKGLTQWPFLYALVPGEQQKQQRGSFTAFS